ncbi:MAG: DUF29 domain-containing protein [Thiohalocapsa sp.]|jgi:hypothetical protein|uniref:DUF29 domain-containing protein n=1 Tax=Thiohalocapsa sp. TaxID=2497641 RepID=UPI0025D3FA4D|nr:DUF29 domain-containing protein [Thiohalocapsa sp.]MCG6939804.1 DUF29 domain-containing protein [Thiohalocapsa sp.]
MTMTRYDEDIAAWSAEQAALLREARFDALDLEHIADEIEDVGRSERRELANRMAALLAHLLQWQYQPERQSNSWRRTIQEQRRALRYHLNQVPSLKPTLADAQWQGAIWADAVTKAIDETGMGGFPEDCPWTVDEILGDDFLPG